VEYVSGPVLVAVDADAGVVRDVERELRDRYARHYRVVCMRSPREVLARLEGLAAEGQQVALVLAGQRLSGMTGSELLDQARHLHPHARRGLLMAWDSVGTGRPARRSSIRLPAVGSTTTWSGRQNRYPLRQRPVAYTRGASGDRRQLSPPRHSGDRGAERCRCVLWRSGFRGACRRRPGRLRPRGRELSWAGCAAPRSLRPARHARNTCSNPRRRDVSLPGAPGEGHAERAGPSRDRDRRRRG
jgi:CheY-like chemotaxis protein